jgi:hypothetical protein
MRCSNVVWKARRGSVVTSNAGRLVSRKFNDSSGDPGQTLVDARSGKLVGRATYYLRCGRRMTAERPKTVEKAPRLPRHVTILGLVSLLTAMSSTGKLRLKPRHENLHGYRAGLCCALLTCACASNASAEACHDKNNRDLHRSLNRDRIEITIHPFTDLA